MSDKTKNLLLIVVGLLAVQLIINIYMKKAEYFEVVNVENVENSENSENVENNNENAEYFKAEPNVITWPSRAPRVMWDNGGVYNGMGMDGNNFETKLACSCAGYGFPLAANQNMPFNDDSNLYNSKLLRHQSQQ